MPSPSSLRPLMVAALSLVLCFGAAGTLSAQENDPLHATLLESRDKGRGVTLLVHGNVISLIVTAIEEPYVIGRSQQASRIVVRLDRIDGVSAAF
jgi:hypothetical protein